MASTAKKQNHHLHMIIGCGRFGAGVASMFSSDGLEVVTIDVLKDSFNRLSPSYTGFTIEADACDIHALENADIKEASVVLVATGDDNINIMVSQVAKVIFEVPTVITRLYDTEKEALLTDSGVNVIYPAKLEIGALRKIFGIAVEE